MKTAAEIRAGISQASGTGRHYPHWTGFFFTEGVKQLADGAECHWLLDIIGSYRPEIARKAKGKGKGAELWRDLADMQFWTLKVLSEEERKGKDHVAVVTCADGNGNVMIRQEIHYTDFPLPEVKIWVEFGSTCDGRIGHVAMLPGER